MPILCAFCLCLVLFSLKFWQRHRKSIGLPLQQEFHSHHFQILLHLALLARKVRRVGFWGIYVGWKGQFKYILGTNKEDSRGSKIFLCRNYVLEGQAFPDPCIPTGSQLMIVRDCQNSPSYCILYCKNPDLTHHPLSPLLAWMKPSLAHWNTFFFGTKHTKQHI